MKPIRLSLHAQSYLIKRGFSFDEVESAIRDCEWQLTDQGRYDCRKNFTFEKMWNGVHYSTKQVRPIFVEEENEIVVITVYTYFF
ncbi:MAG: DUF4258 domain-containing protein [Ignavibacteriaceae bacterium]